MDIQNLGWSVSRTGASRRRDTCRSGSRSLPPGHDPDSLLRAEGAAALTTRLDAARPLLSFVLEKAFADEDLTTARGRANAHARVALILSKVANAEEATELAREAARRLGVDSTSSGSKRSNCRRPRPRPPAGTIHQSGHGTGESESWPPPIPFERDLVALLLQVDEARAELLPVLTDEDVIHQGLRLVLTALRRTPSALPRH